MIFFNLLIVMIYDYVRIIMSEIRLLMEHE